MRFAAILLPLISGVALFLAFPPWSVFPLAWIGLIPYLYFVSSRPPWGQTFLAHLVFASAYFGGVLYWIPRVMVVFGGFGWPGAVGVYGLLLLSLAVFVFPFTLLTRLVAVRSSKQALICAAGFWLLTEVLRNFFLFGGFPWALLGYSQYPYPWLIQIADLGGVYLVSFIVVLTNAALLSLFRHRAWKFMAVCSTLLLFANAYGIYRCYFWRADKTRTVDAALIQPNVELAADHEHYASKYFESIPAAYSAAVNTGVDLVIIPEAQNPYFINQDFYFKNFYTRLVTRAGAALLFNSTMMETGNRYYNSALLIGPKGDVTYRHDKIHLVPFGEYVPAREWLGFVEPIVKEVGGFAPGRELRVGRIGDVRFATLICYEGIFPEIAREFQKRGAELLVILTNDAWYGRTAAPEQHLEIAAFRAIENRRMILRAANSGYTAIIDELGRFRRKTRLFEEDAVKAEAAALSGRTPYSYVGEWLNIVLIGLAVPLAFTGKDRGTRRRGSRKRKR